MKILVKLPSRERPEKCVSIISEYKRLADNPDNIYFMVSYDLNDPTMNNPEVLERIKQLGAYPIGGYSANKIHAINRDMEYAPEFDIAVLASDDMICETQGWDTIITNKMKECFPDTNGCLWFWDGDKNTRYLEGHDGLCTMNIMGFKYLEGKNMQFYHNSYKSLWCDNEYMIVALRDRKMVYDDRVLFRHIHFSNTPGLLPDPLMRRTQAFYHIDEATFKVRQSQNFPN